MSASIASSDVVAHGMANGAKALIPRACEECEPPAGSDGQNFQRPVFASEEELLEHKLEMVRKHETHMRCHRCKVLFRTLEGLLQHYQTVHPAEQELLCPGCKKTYTRLGALISHYETQGCRAITMTDIANVRAKKVGFAMKLQMIEEQHRKRVGRTVQFGPGKMSGNFARFLGMEKHYWGDTDDLSDKAKAKASLFENDSPTLDKEKDFPRTGVQAYRRGDSKQPDLLTEDNLRSLDQATNVWGQKKRFFPEAHWPIRSTEQQPTAVRDAPKRKEDLDPHDPDHPDFSTGRYFNAYTKKFQCPHKTCGKSTPTPQGLISHLKSSLHTSQRVQCPSCLGFFNGLTALTQHAESQAMQCDIRNSDQYRQFVDQLTGGLGDIQGRHSDQTIRYVVPQHANDAFIAAVAPDRRRMLLSAVQERQRQAEQEQIKETQDYWKHHQPDWS